MIPTNNETPGIATGGFEKPGYPTQTHTQDTPKVSKTELTQRDRVLLMLAADDAVCATTFFRAFIPRAAAVVHRLRREGFVIWTRPCSQDHAHAHPQIEYVLVALPEGRMHVG